MIGLTEAAIDVLTPLVGRPMATVYVGEGALESGKTLGTLQPEDYAAVTAVIRRLMAPFTSSALLDDAFAEIARRIKA